MEIRDTDTGEGIPWATIFFRLHHYCNLNKWEIFEYTLPQVTELMKQIDQHIQFEVKIKSAPFGMFGGGTEINTNASESNNQDYHEVTEDDIGQLAKLLGGG